MSIRLPMDEFCAIAKRVCDELPAQFKAWMTNVTIDVRLRPTIRQLRSLGLDPECDEPLGLFEGVPVTDQPADAPHMNRIWLFKSPIESVSRSADEAAYEIRRTIIHELAHHFGWSEDDLDEFEAKPSPFGE